MRAGLVAGLMALACSSPARFHIAVQVTGLVAPAGGSAGLVLANGSDQLKVGAAGSFTFAGEVEEGGAYQVTVATQPSKPVQTCTVMNGEGKVGEAAPSVQVACGDARYPLRVVVNGLHGAGLKLRAGSDELAVTSSGTAAFATPLPLGAPYSVTVAAEPAGQRCRVVRGSGKLAEDVAVVVACVGTGSGNLRLAEIGPGSAYIVPTFIELWNDADEAADLSRYKLRAPAVPATGGAFPAPTEFPLPALQIPPGARVVLIGGVYPDAPVPPGGATLRAAPNLVPYWNGNGHVELVYDGYCYDFVRFGKDETTPITDGWLGEAALAAPKDGAGRSLSRDGAGTDTDTGADWTRGDATPGGPNDVGSSVDDDLDGIPDSTEAPGATFNGLDVYALGARPGQKDLFVEIDSIVSSQPGVVPRRDALDKMKAMFAAHQIVAHFDVGDLFDRAPGIDPADHDLGGGEQIAGIQGNVGFPGFIGPGDTSISTVKSTHFDPRRLLVFHYVLSGNGAGADGGRGELLGNDVVINLGGPTATLDEVSASAYQALVIAHELGHNLGLDHGGDVPTNHKPNYVSIMNYLYITGLPVIGLDEGDRYRNFAGCNDDFILTNPPWGDLETFRIDFSDGSGQPIDEGHIVENDGLRRAGSDAVDFDCDGVIDAAPYSRDVNQDGDIGMLTDHDDWGHIDLRFRRALDALTKNGELIDDEQPTLP